VYTFSGGQTKLVQNKQFNNLKNNYELTFSAQSEIRAVVDDSGIKAQTFSFIKIASLNDQQPNSTVDVLAVVRNMGEMTEVRKFSCYSTDRAIVTPSFRSSL
jgi:replication factor A1